MPQYVERSVREFQSNGGDSRATLLLGVDGDREELSEELNCWGVQVEDEIGRATLRVVAPREAIARLRELDKITSIEFDEHDVHAYGADAGN
jgi:hypothetical protein